MLLSIGVYAITAQPPIIVQSSQSGVSRLARSRRAKRVWFLDLPVEAKVEEIIKEVAERVIYHESREDALEKELLTAGIEYKEKYLVYLNQAISIIREQMLDFAADELDRKLKNRKKAIYLLLH